MAAKRWTAVCMLAGLVWVQPALAAGPLDLRADQARLEQRIRALAQFGKNPEGGVSRVAFSRADIGGRAYVTGLMREAGLEVSVDVAGNIIGRRAGTEADLRPIMFGSHIDSVPHGGNYDGNVGVMAAIEAAQLLHENGVETRHPLEVIVFSDEEGGLVGSRALTQGLRETALEVVAHSGLTIRDGVRAIGGDPDKLDKPLAGAGDFTAFIEVHIEQGAFLHDDGRDIGVVEGIVGIRWWNVTLEGTANHAGTTPMNKRRDAMVAAARLTLAINDTALNNPGRQVATVGVISAHPGAPNVVPGRVVMSLEIRDLSAEKMQWVFDEIGNRADAISAQTGVAISFAPVDVASVPTPTDPRMRGIIADSAKELGLSWRVMPSGAGHDAQEMATIAPTGMIFVPSVKGISHSPEEFTRPRDIANGANVLLRAVLKIDGGALD